MTPEQIKSTMDHWAGLHIDDGEINDLTLKLLGKDDAKPEDPYRTTIHYLSGLIAFCLAVLAGVFANFSDAKGTALYAALGGILTWMAITALVAAAMAITQVLKVSYRQDWTPDTTPPSKLRLYLLMGVPTLFGLMPVIYCLRGGAVMLSNETPPLLSLGDAIGQLF